VIEFIYKVKVQTCGKWNLLQNPHLTLDDTFQGHLDSAKA